MKIGLYGLPCAGKTSLISKLDDSVISEKHYSFLEDVVFTEEDGKLYDVFLYLYCTPHTILDRMLQSETNAKYVGLSSEVVKRWQDFEIASLRLECHKRDKDFYVIDDNETSESMFLDFIMLLKSGFGSCQQAERIVQKIRSIYPQPCELYVIDGDKTLIKQDSFRFCCNGTTQVFDRNFYTGYQAFLFKQELKEIKIEKEKIEQLEWNDFIVEKIKDEKKVILSSGIKELWEQIAFCKHFTNVFADPMISADTKYYVIKQLRKSGYRIIAYGDSKMDLYMLQEADEGILVVGNRLSRSLRQECISGLKVIYDMEPYVLADEKDADVQQDIAICKSSSGINGRRLAAAHLRLGWQIGSRIAEMFSERDTAVLVLERGGRFFGDGLYSAFGGTFYSFHPKKDPIPNITKFRTIIVDSVINTGSSLVQQIDLLREMYPDMEVIIAVNVIQRKALELFKEYKVYAVRVSDNYFVGRNQAKQIAETGPDTAERLFNLIKDRF